MCDAYVLHITVQNTHIHADTFHCHFIYLLSFFFNNIMLSVYDMR